MSKLNPKAHEQKLQEIIVLSDLLLMALDEYEANSKEVLKFKREANEFCEKAVNIFYKSKFIRSTTYLNDLAIKVKTVIRRNFESINNA